jgi:fumarate reductase flavoprotein subunit
MNTGKTLKHQSLSTQIVIIGGGGAGLTAAVVAAEKGANVILVEKERNLGGNSSLAEGLLAAESPAQKRLNIDAKKEEIFKIAMDYAHYKLDGRLVRAFIDKSGDTIRWLEEKGFLFDWIPNYYPNQRIPTWHYIRGRGIKLIKFLTEECENLGVTIIRKARVNKLLISGDGKLNGVIVNTADSEIKISAKSAIIATGGYGGNKKLLKKYSPFYNDNWIYRGIKNQGDGLLMSLEAGAATEGLGILQLSGHAAPKFSEYINAIVEQPNTIWVNNRGSRFIDEAAGLNHFESVNAVIRQPSSVCYTILDEQIKQDYIENGIIKGLGQIVRPGAKILNLGEELLNSAKKAGEWITISNSWDDIARWIGTEPEHLKTTIDEYNSFCDEKYDRIFAKDSRYLDALKTPPYYAIKCYPSFLSTIGGIKINHNMEVLDKKSNPIPGLYAAGSDTGGWETDTYNAVLSGTTFGYAINSGRIAGENATAFVLK